MSDSSCGELRYGGTPWEPLIEYFRSRVPTDLERLRLQIQNMTAEALHQLLGHKVARRSKFDNTIPSSTEIVLDVGIDGIVNLSDGLHRDLN